MTAPYAAIYERDESGYINSQQTVNAFIASWAPCGPVGTRLAINSKAFYNTYTPDGQYKSGYPVAFLNAEALFNINSPVYFCRVVPEDALYGGAVVTIGNAKPSYSLPNGLASPEAFAFAAPIDEQTQEQISVLCKADTNASLGGTYFYLPNQTQYVYFKNTARAEVTAITCNADTAGSLTSTYFVLPGQTAYAWLNVDATGVNPGDANLELANMTAIEVAVAANAQGADIATAIKDALLANETVAALITTETNEAVLTITMKETGAIQKGNAGTTGFTYLTTIKGVNAGADVELSDLTGIKVEYEPDATAEQIATALNAAMANNDMFTSAIDQATTSMVIITAKEVGFMTDAIDGEVPTTFVISTIVQGSSQSGSEALMFYSADPNALNLSFQIFSHQDNPTKAPEPYTFVVAVYKDGVLETEITCSRKQDLKDGLGNPLYVEQAMLASAYVRCRDNVNVGENEMPASMSVPLKITGGTPGTNATTGDMIDAVKPWYNKSDFDVTLIMVGGYNDPAYVMELENLAKTRGDCCVINSIPYTIENTADYLTNIVNYRKEQLNINSSYIATFSSSLKVYNSGLNRDIYIPSDGHVTGAIINASRNYEIFYPILGFKRGTLSNVLDVRRRYQKEEMDVLYNNQINPIRYVPGRGIVIWGQKTMQTQASALDRLNARLLLCSIKPQLQQFLEENIGELNTDQTRDKIILILSDLFDTIKAKQGILAYEVACDPLDANDPNKLSVNVKLQITPAIEYAELTLTLVPSGVTFG